MKYIFSLITSRAVLPTLSLAATALLLVEPTHAQYVLSTDCQIDIKLTDNNCPANDEFSFTVSGVPCTQLGVDVYVASLSLILQHDHVDDLQLALVSPNGQSVDLAIAVGGDGDNFGDPASANCSAVTRFEMDGAEGPVFNGNAPFIGTYIPEGNFAAFDDQSDPNGTWKLTICDNFPQDTGYLKFLQISFNKIDSCLETEFGGIDFASGNMFDLQNNGTQTINIESWEVLFAAGPALVSMDIFFTTVATSHVGSETNPDAWSHLGRSTVIENGGLATFYISGLSLAPGERKGIYIFSSSLPMFTTTGAATYSDDILLIDADPGSKLNGRDPFEDPESGKIWNGRICYSIEDSSPDPCTVDDLVVGPGSITSSLHAIQSITTNGIVNISPNSDVTWKAGNHLIFGPECSLNGPFAAFIEDCPE